MADVTLHPFLREGLDVLFVALNAPAQSNANAHWFSGQKSRMYELMYRGGLLTRQVQKSNGDEVIFGSTSANYKGAQFGMVDLVEDVVETNSSNVVAGQNHVDSLVRRIRTLRPRFVCVMHSGVREALNKYAGLSRPLDYGMCGAILPGSDAQFVLNYFPNGNPVPDTKKIAIFGALRDAL